MNSHLLFIKKSCDKRLHCPFTARQEIKMKMHLENQMPQSSAMVTLAPSLLLYSKNFLIFPQNVSFEVDIEVVIDADIVDVSLRVGPN